ncbi:DUF1000-domain-containing protein [Tilletiopsis washingtonensis]|uniref:DUF1000-domain-containing protein n=1 Tax=Tilletiopsis washingtonensis TaxID=58919 RepID=A0A316ZFC0_9BASI|nr:DUF1000-domain-containing protein [Tilletiopsis washingtonensis]PWN99045.1 DUF1000-domain-containing protein [Tilletiopsis washingtonensis]
MSCNDEATSTERSLHAAAQSGDAGAASGADDARSLYPSIRLDQVWGLNVAPPEGAKTCVKPWHEREDTGRWTESGVDDQFVVTIPFTCPVRMKSILINPGRGDFAPRRVRAYVNRPNGIDFEEVAASSAASAPDAPARERAALGPVGSGKPQADFALREGETGVSEYPVSAARFSNVNSISLVLSDSNMQTLSRVFYLGMTGTALELKQEPGDKLDIAAANAADRPVDSVRERSAAAQQGSAR